MGTFSKSLASLGGYMAAPADIIDYVRHVSRPFIFSASMTPASAACALAALKVLEQDPSLPVKLRHNGDYMREGMRKRGIPHIESSTPIVPIYTYETMRTLGLATELFEKGVYVNPSLPPATPPGGCLLRCSLMASHTEELIDEALDVIDRVLKEDKWKE
jgi:7-keto-8-aminopelargonate synthetase-like enzyme